MLSLQFYMTERESWSSNYWKKRKHFNKIWLSMLAFTLVDFWTSLIIFWTLCYFTRTGTNATLLYIQESIVYSQTLIYYFLCLITRKKKKKDALHSFKIWNGQRTKKKKVPVPGFLLVLNILIGQKYSSILSWTCQFSSVWSCF